MATLRTILHEAAQLPDRIRHNRDLFGAVFAMARTRSKSEREAALATLNDWTARKQFQNALEPAKTSPKGLAAQLLGEPDIRAALAGVPHLGCLSPLSNVLATRLDYVYFITDALLEIKRRNPGLGLGSVALRHEGVELTGLELAQSWAVIFNCGHLFGTFATERALLSYLAKSADLRGELVAALPDGFRKKARGLLAEKSMYRLFYVLAALRAPRLARGCRTGLIARVLQEYPVQPNSRSNQNYYWAYKRARQIAYCRLHSLLRQGISFDQASYTQMVRHLRQYESLGFDPIADQVSSAANLLSSLDAFHTDSVFASVAAADLVLNHLRSFRVWWNAQEERGVGLIDRIDRLSEKPHDWPPEKSAGLQHYHRLTLPSPKDGWIGEIRDWLGTSDDWEGADFLITPPPDARPLIYDIYSATALKPRTVYHVASLLGLRNAATWQGHEDTDRQVWRAVASLGLRLLQDIVRPEYLPILEPTEARDEHIGYALICQSSKTAKNRLRAFIEAARDGQRRSELSAILEYLPSEDTTETCHVLVFLGRLFLVDRESKQQRKEIDGALVRIFLDRTEWVFFEHKSGGRGTGKAQMEALAEFTTVPMGPPELLSCPKGRAWVVQAVVGSPGIISQQASLLPSDTPRA